MAISGLWLFPWFAVKREREVPRGSSVHDLSPFWQTRKAPNGYTPKCQGSICGWGEIMDYFYVHLQTFILFFFTKSINFSIQKNNNVVFILEEEGRGERKGRRAKSEMDEHKCNCPQKTLQASPPNPYENPRPREDSQVLTPPLTTDPNLPPPAHSSRTPVPATLTLSPTPWLMLMAQGAHRDCWLRPASLFI